MYLTKHALSEMYLEEASNQQCGNQAFPTSFILREINFDECMEDVLTILYRNSKLYGGFLRFCKGEFQQNQKSDQINRVSELISRKI